MEVVEFSFRWATHSDTDWLSGRRRPASSSEAVRPVARNLRVLVAIDIDEVRDLTRRGQLRLTPSSDGEDRALGPGISFGHSASWPASRHDGGVGSGTGPATPAAPISFDWRACDNRFECATATVPRDYDRPRGSTLSLDLVRRPATDPSSRVGSLFVNPGGPGGSGVDFVRGSAEGALAALNRHFDLVGFDPRGVGASRPAVSCLTADEAHAQFDGRSPAWRRWCPVGGRLGERVGAPVHRPQRRILPYLSTGNAARDLDVLRAAVRDPKLTYFGFSYGTLLGATYASLFPDRVRALALDGAIDPDVWINRPLEATREQVAGSERALRDSSPRVAGAWCGFGGDDPEQAFDELRASLGSASRPAGSAVCGSAAATGDTLLVAAASALDSKAPGRRWRAR